MIGCTEHRPPTTSQPGWPLAAEPLPVGAVRCHSIRLGERPKRERTWPLSPTRTNSRPNNDVGTVALVCSQDAAPSAAGRLTPAGIPRLRLRQHFHGERAAAELPAGRGQAGGAQRPPVPRWQLHADKGVIENERGLREELQAEGVVFKSETDTDVNPSCRKAKARRAPRGLAPG